ncbi:CMP/dCMP deaminase zinc-binding [Chlorobaculum parvum NCIB 8327]|uniref:CMP/dCMP deaminase zinc-binding n=1 Tax=Chlorobaculum parvum (strain DSM 263 / NCIMB 8327) TaxID=517417 RepID=B3QPH4_CHLP8|nr:nucleoside deaminase [Chlorobaculum parvum]ACF11827.1 CMP/dCMP deaminase zinc-binding [Chlorobaculum parvum NCIB 8327]
MTKQPNIIEFTLPEWLAEYAGSYRASVVLEERMRFVIEAARRNIEEKTGGPFAAAVFEHETGKLVSLGVNLVVSRNSSILHAEMVAIMLAQQQLDTYDLGDPGMPAHELLSSAEPCAMCFGALPWSGVQYVATGAQSEDAKSIGFDEGAKPENWIAELESRGIQVSTDVERERARKVLLLYQQSGGRIYNSKES